MMARVDDGEREWRSFLQNEFVNRSRITKKGVFFDVLSHPTLCYKRSRHRKMSTALFDGEEAFVLEVPQLHPMPAPLQRPPFVLEGWEDDGDHAPPRRTPYALPSVHRLRQRVQQMRLKAQELRKKAVMPKFRRLFQKLAYLQRRVWEAIKGGVQRAASVVGGKRKRVMDGGDSESDGPEKRPRLEDAPVEPEVHDGHVEDPADFEFVDYGFDEFEYGPEEDREATNAILGAVDEFNGNVDDVEAHVEEPAPQLDAGDVGDEGDDAVVEEAEDGVDIEANVEEQPAVAQEAAAPVPSVHPEPLKRIQRPENAAELRRLARRSPHKVIQTARGTGFKVHLLANGTAKIIGNITGVDQSRSSFFKGMNKNGITIAAPYRSRIVQVVAGTDHVLFRTSRDRVMLVGNNAWGQLGTRRHAGLSRVADQTLGSMQRGPIGMAGIKIRSIQAHGSESWIWDAAGRAYRCGTAKTNNGDIRWSSSTFVPDTTQNIVHP